MTDEQQEPDSHPEPAAPATPPDPVRRSLTAGLAPLPEPVPGARLRKGLLIALIAVVAAAGVVWLFVRPDDPRPECCTETSAVVEPETGLTYPLPEGWYEYKGVEFIEDVTSGARTETDEPIAQIWTFVIPDWSGDPKATAEESARITTGIFYAAVPEEWEFLSSETRTIGGTEAYEVSWVVSHPRYEESAYGRLLQIPSEDGLSARFLFSLAYPDDEALRDEVDWIFANASLHR
ncbi:hypothetical protein [Glycomyces paridis]|uniref:Uncharacterized protein n=1 Tax=Glycomyces paridis TaxID=2126555 RepID=A0A4V4HPP4_9ACTN|nr:hypothetical protein [Glycomyces paridis]THV30756.1 hypothetical protein E9998_05075 [Glycomyces paridis]